MNREEKIGEVMRQFPDWEREGEYLKKTFVFPSFHLAIQSMQDLASHINELNHHPEWKNIYNRIEVKLTTHDTGGITEKDLQLLVLIEKHWGKS